LSTLREEQTTWNGFIEQLDSLEEIQVMLDDEPDPDMIAEVTRSLDALTAQLEKLRLRLMLSGEHDEADAIFSIHVGNGGVDAQDWVEMMLRMYMRWMQDHGYKMEELDRSEGEEAGLKSVTLAVSGRYAYGYLHPEAGVHRLIRLSPFDAAHRRQTSFAKVEVLPDIERDIEITIRPEDLDVDTYRSTGAGGQHVNKTDSAVRIRHKPTGIVVTCQNERSQIQNREVALRILKAKLYDLEVQQQQEAQAKLRGEHREVAFGSQIRTVTLHPYTLVKDHRTNAETGNTVGYLDGDIDLFIEAMLAQKLSEASVSN
jgi:peptide chain release factor 2